MKYKFQVENKPIEVEITNSATFHSETSLKINHDHYNVCIGDIRNNEVTSFMLNNKLYQVELEKNNEGYPTGIYVNGDYYAASLLKIDRLFYYQEKKPLQSSKSGVVKSFIPGSIKKIFFRVNDKVSEGQIILIHEAMKMENEIRAPKSGRIKSIGVTEGENILANHLLFEIE
ncbi:MAG TPA: acetyl-CoA carboxylase biotin carboxyl carrier protein subunit [Candidatus Kapabacteria bacterium]|nr:acetyl-CoA carboxylase biotin carboxyl carrier protein subunit [Candidatus Kapabacteria bacterium]